jgi:hypothetical protein
MDWWDTPTALVMQPDTSKALKIEKPERALIAQYQAILAQTCLEDSLLQALKQRSFRLTHYIYRAAGELG